MATKMKLMTFLQQVRGYAEITNRRPTPRPAVIYLMELRSQAVSASVPKRRLAVQSGHNGLANIPLPVKITHLKHDKCPLPVVIG